MIDLRLRSRVHPDELAAKVGKVLGPADHNVLLTGPARVHAPDGALLAVYLPGSLAEQMDAALPTLQGIRVMTDNRGKASGTERIQRGDQARRRTRKIWSATLGSVDPGPSVSRVGGRLPVCRMTSWTAQHVAEWQALQPLWARVADLYAEHVPDRYRAQQAYADATPPEWVIPGTPFTTVTVNNTYATGVHQDAGDLKAGFSTLAVARRGEYTGGLLVLAEYRVAVDMRHGDLLLFNPHAWHGNTAMHCPHLGPDVALNGAHPHERCTHGCERISVVAYFREKVQGCATADEAAELATTHMDQAAQEAR